MSEEYVEQILQGDQEAFRRLYEKYSPVAMRVAYAITRDREMAKDVLQETFVRVYRFLPSYDLSQSFRSWFYRILTNECNRMLKKQHRLLFVHTPNWEEQMADRREDRELDQLYGAIQELEDKYRIPVVLKYLQGLTEKEIAEALDLNQNTVKTRLFQARQKLKKAIVTEEQKGG